MRTVKYTGKPMTMVRHGKVTKGMELHLTEVEWWSLRNSSDYREVSPPKPVEGVLPQKAPSYDLRLVRWSSSRLGQTLHKLAKAKLRKIASAMHEVGTGITVPDGRASALTLVDDILHHAAVCGWRELEARAILTSGVLEPTVPEKKDSHEARTQLKADRSTPRKPSARKRAGGGSEATGGSRRSRSRSSSA